jgi:hypothetical protein
MRSPGLFVALLAALGLWSCGKEKLIVTACRDDSACPQGEICEEFRCVPAATRACSNVVSGNPILQPDPYAISFGDLDVSSANQKLTIHNIGNCTLTLFEASLADKNSSFTCDLCAANFPIEVFPGRSKEFTVGFATNKVGRAKDEIRILSDDKEFSELKIPLTANFLGEPKLTVSPSPIDFGYVAMGRQGARNVQISNQGTGVAPLTVESIAFSDPTTMDFAFAAPFVGPKVLNPVANDTTALIPLELRYTPRSTAKHAMELVVTTNKGVVRVPMAGNAETPPQLTFNPPSIDLGNVPLGATNLIALTLTNMGGAPLLAQLKWGGTNPNTDLFTSPTLVPPIIAGAFIDVQVGFTATAIGPVTGLLNLTSNDPSKPSITIPVTANGVMGAGNQVVKLEMVYENGTDSVFDNDVRNVDMTLEHPYGYVCNKQTPNPMNWGNFGKPTWLSFAPKEEPERIVLADSMNDGTYRVMLQYVESCSSIPTGLLAGLLGISTEVLIAYLSGGTVPVQSDDVSKLVEKICLSNSSSSATVRAYVNGTLIKEKTVSLSKKGDSVYALDLVRLNGVFTAK